MSSAIVGASGAYIWVHPEAIGMDPETNGWVAVAVEDPSFLTGLDGRPMKNNHANPNIHLFVNAGGSSARRCSAGCGWPRRWR